MLSIICAYNNKKMLNDCVVQSLLKQKNVEYEKIFVNAKDRGFSSAAETLNYGGEQANGDFLIFLHQDIIFETNDVLSKIENYCKTNSFGIAGVAGIVKEGRQNKLYTQIKDGEDHIEAGGEGACHSYTKPLKAVSLDECLFIIPKKVFKSFQFSDLGSTWHLYASDYACHCIKNKLNVLILPIQEIWHLSDGKSFNMNYFDALGNLVKLYQKDFQTIYTIFGKWSTNRLIFNLKVLYRKLRYKISKR